MKARTFRQGTPERPPHRPAPDRLPPVRPVSLFAIRMRASRTHWPRVRK